MRAIDVHVHVPRQPGLKEFGIEQGLRTMFRMREDPPDPDGMAKIYRDLDVLAVIFSVDSQTATGDVPDSNDYVAEIASAHPEQFIGFASVDPHKGEQAVEELERAVGELGLKGLKLHPIHQAFFPSDEAFRPLFDKCEELGVPVLIHSGYAAAGAGTPGGGGFKLKYARPIPCIDDLAADHPDLTIIMAHPAWPWVDEQVAVAPPQAERLHRPVRMGAAVHPTGTHPRGEHTPAGQGAVRFRLPVHAAVEMAARVRRPRNAGRAEAKSPAGQRQAGAWAVARVRVNRGGQQLTPFRPGPLKRPRGPFVGARGPSAVRTRDERIRVLHLWVLGFRRLMA